MKGRREGNVNLAPGRFHGRVEIFRQKGCVGPVGVVDAIVADRPLRPAFEVTPPPILIGGIVPCIDKRRFIQVGDDQGLVIIEHAAR